MSREVLPGPETFEGNEVPSNRLVFLLPSWQWPSRTACVHRASFDPRQWTGPSRPELEVSRLQEEAQALCGNAFHEDGLVVDKGCLALCHKGCLVTDQQTGASRSLSPHKNCANLGVTVSSWWR